MITLRGIRSSITSLMVGMVPLLTATTTQNTSTMGTTRAFLSRRSTALGDRRQVEESHTRMATSSILARPSSNLAIR